MTMTGNDYEYMESAIDDGLKCECCKKPCIDPVVLPPPCEQTFCRRCIELNLANHSTECAKCDKRSLSIKDLIPEGPTLRRMLDRILVKCNHCGQPNIQRITFDEHVTEQCPKRIVACYAADIKCSWNGPYEELSQHMALCSHELIRPVLLAQITENNHLNRHCSQLQNDLNRLRTENQCLTHQSEQLQTQNEKFQTENECLTEQCSQQKVQIDEFRAEYQRLEQQCKQQETQIDDLQKENHFLKDQCSQQKVQIDGFEAEYQRLQQQQTQIDDLQKENHFLKDQCSQQKVQIDGFEAEYQRLQQQQTQIDDLQKENHFLKDQCNQKQTQIGRFEAENQRLSQQSSQQRAQTDGLQTDIERLKYQSDQQHDQIASFQAENQRLNQQSSEQNTLIDRFQTENQRLKEQCTQYEAHTKKLETKIQQLNAKFPKPKLEIEKMATHDHRNHTLEDLINQCRIHSMMNLNGQKLIDKDIDIVVTMAIVQKQCAALVLSHNEITSQGALIIASALNNNTTLEKLSLVSNHVSDRGVNCLAQALSINNTTLKVLVLSSNDITDEGAQYLAEMLETNRTLTVLGLQENKIGDPGVRLLADALAVHNKSLEELSIYSNKLVTDSSINTLVKMLTQNRSLKSFWMWDCNLSENGKEKLRQVARSRNNFDFKV